MNKGLEIKEGWIILLVVVAITTVASLATVVLPLNKDLESFLTYFIGMGASALIAIRIYQKQGEKFKLHLNSNYLKYLPLVVVLPILMQFGITSHIVNLIPMPEFVKAAFYELGERSVVLSVLIAVLLAPVLEELICRGVILKGYLQRYSPVKAIVISSIIFGVMHLNPWQFIGAFAIGLLCGWVYWKTNNLVMPIAIHLSNNLFFSIFGHYYGISYLVDQPMREVVGSPMNQVIMITLSIVMFGLILYVLSGVFKPTNIEQEEEAQFVNA